MGEFFGSTTNPRSIGGKRFFSARKPVAAAPAGANLIIRAAAGPPVNLADVAAGGAPADQILGDFGTLVSGPVGTFFKLFASGADMVLQTGCAISQHQFTNIQMLDFGVGYDSATAVFSPGCGFNQWTWVARAVVLVAGTVYNMKVT